LVAVDLVGLSEHCKAIIQLVVTPRAI